MNEFRLAARCGGVPPVFRFGPSIVFGEPSLPIVNFTDRHLPALLDFVESQSDWGSHGRDLGREIFRQIAQQPWLDIHGNCWLLEDHGVVNGFCLVHREPFIGRAVLQMEIAPDLANSDQQIQLLDWAVKQIRVWGPKVVHVCLPAGSDQRAMLETAGFSQVRSYTNLLWQGDSLPSWSTANGYHVRPYAPGDEALLTEVQNSSFGGSWGFCPNTVEQIKYRADMANTRHQGILFLSQSDAPGEAAAGYCWTCMVPVPEGLKGIIGMIGVVPQHRGRGISKSMLMAGMDYLRTEGATGIGLEVDSNNDPAMRLYASVGFAKTSGLHWFELDLARVDTGSC